MKKRTIIGLAAIIAAVATMLAAPSVASATDEPECQRGYVSITWERGTGSFTGKTINGGPDCGVRLTSYVGVERQLTAGDYSHPQIAKEWAWAQLTATESKHSVALPSCDNVQVDAYTGPFQFDLPNGDLGLAWVAGGVIERAGQECETEPHPEETVTPEPSTPPATTPPATTPPATETPEVPSSPDTPPQNAGPTPPPPATTSGTSSASPSGGSPNVAPPLRIAPVPTPIRAEAKFTG